MRTVLCAFVIWIAPFSVSLAQNAGWICTQPAVFPDKGNDIARYWVEGNKLFISDKYDDLSKKYGVPPGRWIVVVNNEQGLVAVAADAGIQRNQSYVWSDIVMINKITGELHKTSFHVEDKTDEVATGRCIKG